MTNNRLPRVYFEDVTIGQTDSITYTFTDEAVQQFAEVSGDHNPVHLDEDFAKSTPFGGRIVHGFFVGSLFSTIFGTRFPGTGAIYLEQKMQFKAPVKIGDTVTATVVVTEIIPAKKRVLLTTQAFVNGKMVIDGNATILFPSRAALL